MITPPTFPVELASLPPPVVIGGVPVHPVTQAMVQLQIAAAISANQKFVLHYANIHAINLAQQDEAFRLLLQAAPLVFCDGVGVQLAARLLGHKLPERFTPPDWIDALARRCGEQGWRMFFLGAAEGVAAKAAALLMARYPGLQIDSHHGFFEKTGQQNREVCDLINQAAPQVLIVGFGMPIQEKWIAANLADLNVNLVMAAGALFDYIAGEVVRGPRWLTDNGFEWLCRLFIEPRRLWRRYLLGNPYFVWLVLRQWWHQR